MPMMINFHAQSVMGKKGNLDEEPECKGSLHLIVHNLFVFEVEAIYHEKHRIKFADKNKEAENDNTNDHSTVCNG